MSVDLLISRLEFCKPVGKDRWVARCPAHEDRGPSLSIKALPDGRTLIHCFAGCGGADILAAVGLDFSVLYPPEAESYKSLRRRESVTVDEMVIAICDADRKAGKTLSEADKQRELQAWMRRAYSEPSPEQVAKR
jgi:predicted protein tyrosine phosphatase